MRKQSSETRHFQKEPKASQEFHPQQEMSIRWELGVSLGQLLFHYPPPRGLGAQAAGRFHLAGGQQAGVDWQQTPKSSPDVMPLHLAQSCGPGLHATQDLGGPWTPHAFRPSLEMTGDFSYCCRIHVT